jgi:hypothetical protein
MNVGKTYVETLFIIIFWDLGDTNGKIGGSFITWSEMTSLYDLKS